MTVLSVDGALECADDRRSGVLRNPAHPLNGIDFVEFRREPLDRFILDVAFLKPAPAATVANFAVTGGIRIVDLKVTAVETAAANPLMLRVLVDREGDFSLYVLEMTHPDIDEERSQAVINFKAACPSEFDCRPTRDCPPEQRDEPVLDYLAKDYQSFRRLMVDLIAARNPFWQERLPADLGITLVELLAYAADYLSYYQDAGPGTEGYLDTCLHRISAARHARLIDYAMGQGQNARTFVHFEGGPGANGVVPLGSKVISLVTVPLQGNAAAPSTIIAPTADFDTDPALASSAVFELQTDVRVLEIHNELRIHTWGDRFCCLGVNTTELFLYRDSAGVAVPPTLQAGDYLLLEEILQPGDRPRSGRQPAASAGGADRQRRGDCRCRVYRRRRGWSADTPAQRCGPGPAVAAGGLCQGPSAVVCAMHIHRNRRSSCDRPGDNRTRKHRTRRSRPQHRA